MSDKYDEDLYENPFFITLQNQFSELLSKAGTNGWLVCIPQFSCATKKTVSPGDVEDHILVPRDGAAGEDEVTQVYQSLSSKDSEVVSGKIVTKHGYEVQQEVKILFEETFHTDNDESYRVLCVDRYLNSKTDTPTAEETTTIKRPTSYEQCIDILWNHTGGLKAKDYLDKMLNTFSLAFDQLEGQGLRSIVDVASAQFTKVMQYVLKDSVLKRTARHNANYMENLKIAVETYYMHAVFRKLFRVVTACVGSDDAEINKLTRNLSSLNLPDLGIKKTFSKNVSSAKVELSRMNNFSTPVGRLFCVKRVVAALTRPPKGSAVTDPGDMMTTDDFLPILIYLIVKSEIPNWSANLAFMTHFHFAKCSEDAEFGFYLASIEAALEHIKSGKVREEVLSQDKIKYSWQGVNGLNEETGAIQRQSSGPHLPVVEEFFQVEMVQGPVPQSDLSVKMIIVEGGNEEAVKTLLEKPKKESEELAQKLCHPLCCCDKCDKIQAHIRSNSNLVTAYTRDTRGYTALHIAASCGQAKLIDILVTHGAVVDASDYLGLTPLHLACQKGFQNVMLLLLHFGACITGVDSDGNTPLHLSASNGHEDCVKALIFFDSTSNKININAQNDIGNSALHLASKWGYESIVRVLIESGANPNLRNRKKQTPLSLTQNVTVQRILTLSGRGLDIRPVSTEDVAKAVMAVAGPKSPISPTRPKGVNRVNSVASTSSTVSADRTFKFETASLEDSLGEKLKKKIEKLFRAILDGDTQLVRYYLGFDSPVEDDIDDFDEDLDTVDTADQSNLPCHPLCQCSKCQSHFKKSPVSSNDISVNCRSNNGYTPLHMAVLHQHLDLVTLFLSRGAAINVQNHKLMTSVHLAACMQNEQILKALLDGGGKAGVQDINGDTPLHTCCATGFAAGVSLLLQENAYKSPKEDVYSIDLKPLQHKASVSAQNIKGNTPLHEAAERSHTGIVQVLLKHGAVTRIKNKQGLSAIDVAQDTALKRFLEHHNSSVQMKNYTTVLGAATSDNQKHQVGIRDLFAAFEDSDLETLHKLTASIKTFSRRDSLRKTSTHDLSAPRLDASLARNLSIKTFDHRKLRHIDSQDKSEPLYIYKLALQAQKEYGVPIDDGYCEAVLESDSDDDLFRTDRQNGVKSEPVKQTRDSEMEDLVDVEL